MNLIRRCNATKLVTDLPPPQELTITAGDYLYVFGEMDDDGFYFAQLMNGENGMVPSNFVEKVDEGEEEGEVVQEGERQEREGGERGGRERREKEKRERGREEVVGDTCRGRKVERS